MASAEYQQLMQQKRELDAKIEKATKDALVDSCLLLFEQYKGELENICWWNAPASAYCDGEVPGPSSAGINFAPDSGYVEIPRYGRWWHSTDPEPEDHKRNREINEAVTSALNEFDENMLITALGGDPTSSSGMIVVIWPDRVETFDYEY